MHDLTDLLGDTGRTSELDQANVLIVLREEDPHVLTGAVERDDILLRQPAGMQEADELLHHDRDLGVGLDQRKVAHVEGAHELQGRNLERKVEGRDDDDRAVRPAVATRLLPQMVTRD